MLQTPPPRLACAGSLRRMRLSEPSAGKQENLPGLRLLYTAAEPGFAGLQALTACTVNPTETGGIMIAVQHDDLR